MKRVFFHIHLWKTAGTTFFNICSDNFKKAFHRDIMLIQNWFLSIQQLRWLLDYHDWIRCYSCHMLNGELPYDDADKEVIGIAFVRNPVSRFISSYNFQRRATYRGGSAKEHDFEQFYKNALVNTNNLLWRNGQTHILGGSGTEDGLGKISERIERGQLIVLPTERFNESCILLERIFPDDFEDCSYVRLNTSKQHALVSEQQKNAIEAFMDVDNQLIELANQYLDSTLDSLFENMAMRKQYNKDFDSRCKRKKRKSRLNYIATHPWAAFGAALAKLKASVD